MTTWDALRDLVPFVQLKKREKHTCGSVTLSKVAASKPTTASTNTEVFWSTNFGKSLEKIDVFERLT